MANQPKTIVEDSEIITDDTTSYTKATMDSSSQGPDGKSLTVRLKNWGATKYFTYTLLATTPAAMTSCQDEVVNPAEEVIKDNIDRTTDNPAHRADFAKYAKPRDVITDPNSSVPVVSIKYKIIWIDNAYKILPQVSVNAQRAATALENLSKTNGQMPPEDLMLNVMYSPSGDVARMIPYSILKESTGSLMLNDPQYNKHIIKGEFSPNGGDPQRPFGIKVRGYFGVRIAHSKTLAIIGKPLFVDSEFVFGG